MSIFETSIRDLAQHLQAGRLRAVDLVAQCLMRIERLDRRGPCLNAVPVLNPAALEEARASDLRRAEGLAWPAARPPLPGWWPKMMPLPSNDCAQGGRF
jgi:amidase